MLKRASWTPRGYRGWKVFFAFGGGVFALLTIEGLLFDPFDAATIARSVRGVTIAGFCFFLAWASSRAAGPRVGR